ncbi:MAG: copper resistance protein, partial [Actinomycetota bacterium]|nr:copper resistance protein [Actinomycetota bacterium]
MRTVSLGSASLRSASRGRLATVLALGIAISFALGAALFTSVISAAPASAHAVLVQTIPAANAALTAAPTQVVLKFDEPVGNTFATVLVTSASGVNVARGKPAVLGGTVIQALGPGMLAGTYRIAYQVTSDDGHPVSGESRFTLTLGTTGSATSTAPASPSQATSSPAGAVAVPPVEDSKA